MFKFNLLIPSMWPNMTSTSDSHDNNLNSNNTMTMFSLVKWPHQNLTIDKLTEKFGTTNFLPALSKFLCQNSPGTTITPTYCDHFDAYKQVVISLPSTQFLAEHILMDRVRTACSVTWNASGWALVKAAHLDMVFMVENLALYQSEGGISGMFLFYIYQIYLSI